MLLTAVLNTVRFLVILYHLLIPTAIKLTNQSQIKHYFGVAGSIGIYVVGFCGGRGTVEPREKTLREETQKYMNSFTWPREVSRSSLAASTNARYTAVKS